MYPRNHKKWTGKNIYMYALYIKECCNNLYIDEIVLVSVSFLTKKIDPFSEPMNGHRNLVICSKAKILKFQLWLGDVGLSHQSRF